MVGCSESGGNRVARAVLGLEFAKGIDRLFKPAGEELFISGKGNESRGLRATGVIEGQARRKMEAVNRRQEKQSPSSVIQVLTAGAEVLEPFALGNELLGGGAGACDLERTITHERVGACDATY
jgi:hypothetical protein